MSRRRSATKREIAIEEKYNSENVTRLIRKVMQSGKKSLATRIVYDAIDKFAELAKIDGDVIEAFDQALENAKPKLEVKSRRVGGSTYQVPVEVAPNRRLAMALAWIVTFSRKKTGRDMCSALATELYDCFNQQGTTIKKREDVHKMAEANKAFAHFRW
ncbi:MAG: 30S ribosomal protein S7 [Chlamydiia bacterium]|nr:30S ribosomal protein S7 [Chlamydiia bacterium]